MKQIKIIAIILSIISFVSCSESFLDTELLTQKADVNFYKNKNDAYLALVGCYDGLQKVWSDGIALPVASEVLSDNCFGGTGNTDDYKYQALDEFDKNRAPSADNLFEPNWRDYYAALNRCNTYLLKKDQIDWGRDSALAKVYESEIRFIRAYCYFDMVRLWGNIPLLTEPSTANISQANPEDVYKVIANDLKFACDNLPAKTYTQQNASDFGRVTKWAAEALLARVFLYYTGYYDKTDLVGIVTKAQALAYLEDLISQSGHSLLSNFANLWPGASLDNFAGERNPEVIFSIRYTYTSNYNGNTDGNHWLVMMGIREQYLYPYGLGWGACTVNPKLWNAFDVTDSRQVASIISIADEELEYTKEEKQREYTGYYIKKYTPLGDESGTSLAQKLGGVNFMIGQYQDYISLRYADVLLMAAELGSTNAQNYFNEVRQRAYGANFNEVTVSQAAIMNERRLEFAFEGLRYWDLLRQGLIKASEAISETTSVKNGGKVEAKIISFNAESKGLQQIPYNQITLSNNVLVQNSGW